MLQVNIEAECCVECGEIERVECDADGKANSYIKVYQGSDRKVLCANVFTKRGRFGTKILKYLISLTSIFTLALQNDWVSNIYF